MANKVDPSRWGSRSPGQRPPRATCVSRSQGASNPRMPDRKHPYLLWAYRRTQFFNRSPPSETAETPWGTSVVSLGGVSAPPKPEHPEHRGGCAGGAQQDCRALRVQAFNPGQRPVKGGARSSLFRAVGPDPAQPHRGRGWLSREPDRAPQLVLSERSEVL
ncbi:hypothetical protein SMALA_8649 (plasmid) [Streptomyces malaysiensis subsp. malaysiensis]|nr:hypothetical protein SMALA_8649 [Streptomyces malaysiensis]